MYHHQQLDQIQIYHDLAVDDRHYAYKLSILQHNLIISNHTPNSTSNDQNLLLLNLEVFIVAFLLLTLPILIYLAYRYGKKMGRKESGSPVHHYGPETFHRRFSEESTSDNSLTHLEETDNKPSSATSSPLLNPAKNQGDLADGKQDLSPLSLQCQKREFSVQTEDEKIEEFALDSDTTFAKNLENRLVPLKFRSDGEDFNIIHVQTWTPQTDEKLAYKELFEEKLKLHSDEAQIVRKEVKYGVSFKKNADGFQKREIREVCTTYDSQAETPVESARLLKETYQNPSIRGKLFGTSKTIMKGGFKSDEQSLVGEDVQEAEEVKTEVETALIERRISERSQQQQAANETDRQPLEEAKDPELEARIETVVEKYGLPDETGKFNKIFKDVEWIGNGSFGEVYKVVHRLDGKLYAVKKVQLKLGRFEELKKESKVFREVFAMTDLHHHNIVRYSTCWVEIEWDKDAQQSSSKADKSRRDLDESMDLGDISENEGSDEDEASELESEPADYSRNSDLGFEWDVSEGEKEKPKRQKKNVIEKIKGVFKKAAEAKNGRGLARKSSRLRLKTLSKSFIEEDIDEQSKNSNVSRVESVSEIPGCHLYLYIQMEYCEGQSLRYFLENSKAKVAKEKVLGMFKKLVEGVHAIHSRGILHRDLKPANIFLDSHEDVKIGDFGLALLDKFDEHTEGATPKEVNKKRRKLHSMKVGTPMYTSPEQECGGSYDQKTDIYSLGLIFYEMLVNFETHHERYQHFTAIRSQNELPEAFRREFAEESEVIKRMLSSSAEERPTSEQLLAEVDKLLDGLSVNHGK